SNRCEVRATRFQPDMNHNIDKALSLEPDLVIISFPSNDAASSYLAEESAYNLLLMRDMLAREDVATVIIGAQPRNMSTDKQKLLIELDVLLAERMKACLVKVYQPLVDSAGNLSASFDAGDGVHMNDAGHAIVFDALREMLTPSSANTCFSS
ncbi:MAG: SGNH/GDSL hydrolase family protein, partial [Paraglaciecola sp.]|nr:SGNH/GDSL hydrolase family protein [Paraglaciecola sp.]